MSAWKFMSAADRRTSVLAQETMGFTSAETAAMLGAPLDAVMRIRRERNTDEGSHKPPERPACEGTPTPAAAESVEGAGGPDGGSSTVAGATSGGGGEANRSAAPIEAARKPAEPAQASPLPQIKREKVMRPQKTPGERRDQRGLIARADKVMMRERTMMGRRPDKRQKRMAAAGELRPEEKTAAKPDELPLLIHLPRSVLMVLQRRAEGPRYTRAQMAAAILRQQCRE